MRKKYWWRWSWWLLCWVIVVCVGVSVFIWLLMMSIPIRKMQTSRRSSFFRSYKICECERVWWDTANVILLLTPDSSHLRLLLLQCRVTSCDWWPIDQDAVKEILQNDTIQKPWNQQGWSSLYHDDDDTPSYFFTISYTFFYSNITINIKNLTLFFVYVFFCSGLCSNKKTWSVIVAFFLSLFLCLSTFFFDFPICWCTSIFSDWAVVRIFKHCTHNTSSNINTYLTYLRNIIVYLNTQKCGKKREMDKEARKKDRSKKPILPDSLISKINFNVFCAAHEP